MYYAPDDRASPSPLDALGFVRPLCRMRERRPGALRILRRTVPRRLRLRSRKLLRRRCGGLLPPRMPKRPRLRRRILLQEPRPARCGRQSRRLRREVRRNQAPNRTRRGEPPLTPSEYDLSDVFRRAEELSSLHTPKLGARSLDILHVAAAIELSVKAFVTGDGRQAKLASACRLDVADRPSNPGLHPRVPARIVTPRTRR